MRRFKRVHNTGTGAELNLPVWSIQINLREPNHNPMTITGYVARALALAKELADNEIAKYGHSCNASCQDWKET